MGLNLDEQKAVDRFRKNVAEPSMTQLVILDFWAEWCGPCKALSPVLEKVAADYADKGVVLAKVNVDEEQFIAAQFQVRSIPTVYAIFQGQPVADLTNARTESQLKSLLDKLLSQLPIQAVGGGAPAADLVPLIAMGEEALAGNEAERAISIFSQILEIAPENTEVFAGLMRALIAAEKLDEAQSILDGLTPERANDPQLDRVRAALELARAKPADSELEILRQRAIEHPADMEAQFAFANAAFAAGERDAAADTLLHMVRADRDWNEGAAKAKLLQIFEAIGLEDPWAAQNRRKLSTILFG